MINDCLGMIASSYEIPLLNEVVGQQKNLVLGYLETFCHVPGPRVYTIQSTRKVSIRQGYKDIYCPIFIISKVKLFL